MKPMKPLPEPAASAIFSFAASAPAAVAETSKPAPGLIRLPAIRPERQREHGGHRK